MNKPKIIILLGRSGSGKGTQAEPLLKKFDLDYVGSGDILRARQEVDDFTGKKLKEVLNKGSFAPTAIIFGLWLTKWEELKNSNQNFNGFVIDGSPRKFLEADLIDQTLGWYEWKDYLKVLFVDISKEEAFKRLSKRGRSDDTPDAINSRLDLFDEEVVPVIEYYKKSNRLITINGEQSIEDVHKDIMKALE